MSHKNYRKPEKKYNQLNSELNNSISNDSIDKTKKATSIKSFEQLKPEWRKACEYWKQYPDRFIDYIAPRDCKIKLYFYQRVMLRILFRFKKVYFTFTRGTAKSFTQILAIYLKCIMYPGSKLFITAPGKEQASKIAKENIEDIWDFFPLLKNEVKHVTFAKDYTRLVFHNNSRFDVVQATNASRGGRRHGGAVEEICDESMDKDLLNSAVIPMMANNRIAACSGVDPYEPHKFQFYITTSSVRQSFAYEKLMEVLGEMAQNKSAFSLGSSFDLPCMHGQLDEEFINELREQPTFNPLSFAREYESVWTGSSENSLVSLEDILKCRTLTKAEDKHCGDKDVFYILSYDVSRAEGNSNANCALAIIKCIPRGDGTYQKHLVNMYSFEGTHFLTQALFLKRKVNDFKARALVVDTNGLGVGLVDQLVLEVDENPSYSVLNDERYNKFKTQNSIPMIYAIKSQSKEMRASDIHNVFMSTISNQKIKMLHSESQARAKSKIKDSERMAKELMPFTMLDITCEEIMNLEYKQSGNQTQVNQISKSINKDKFSALEYGLWYIHTLERSNLQRKRETFNASNYMAIKVPRSVV